MKPGSNINKKIDIDTFSYKRLDQTQQVCLKENAARSITFKRISFSKIKVGDLIFWSGYIYLILDINKSENESKKGFNGFCLQGDFLLKETINNDKVASGGEIVWFDKSYAEKWLFREPSLYLLKPKQERKKSKSDVARTV